MKRIGPIDVAIVLGSGLSHILRERAVLERLAYDEIALPFAQLAGHAGHALVGDWQGQRVIAFAGRIHAYQGFAARELSQNVALAAECGARAVLLTNAAGALNPSYKAGDLMVIADHINLTALNPLLGAQHEDPFVNMTDAYTPRLRSLAHHFDTRLLEGVYAGVIGPTYETAAEARYLRTIGADAVGMSTVLETIAARARGLEVFGISVITNVAGAAKTSHADVGASASHAAQRLADLLEHVVAHYSNR